jgi:hypothetical protein
MFKTHLNLSLITLMLALLWSSATVTASASEKNEAAEKENVTAPQAVMAAFHKAYPKASIRDVSTETKDGKSYYEIESIDGDMHRDLLYTPDGKVFEMEEQIAVSDLPAAVSASLKKEFPKGEPKKAERITRDKVVEYEVLLENGEKQMEVLLDSSGTIKSKAMTTEKDENKENHESDEPDEDD